MATKLTLSGPTLHKKFIESLAFQIKSLRLEKNMTPEHFAKQSGLNVNEIYRIEMGKLNPTITTLLSIAQALDCSLKTLFDFN